MFMILPKGRTNTSAEAPEDACSRVKKACSRCRIKKIKCNGRFPCSRSERDEVVCRLEHMSSNNKDLLRSYISSLESEQLSLLNALRDICRSLPDNGQVQCILEKLRATGFDIGSLKLPTSPWNNATEHGRIDLDDMAGQSAWDASGLESLFANPELLDSQNMLDIPEDWVATAMQHGSSSNAPPNSAPPLDPLFDDWTQPTQFSGNTHIGDFRTCYVSDVENLSGSLN